MQALNSLGQMTQSIANYTGAATSQVPNVYVATNYNYNAKDQLANVSSTDVAANPSGGYIYTPQMTTYTYGYSGNSTFTTINNNWLTAISYPQSGVSQGNVSNTYDNLGQPVQMIDRNGVTHQYAYDAGIH